MVDVCTMAAMVVLPAISCFTAAEHCTMSADGQRQFWMRAPCAPQIPKIRYECVREDGTTYIYVDDK